MPERTEGASESKLQVSDRNLLGKPPLAARDHSANTRDNLNSGGSGPRT